MLLYCNCSDYRFLPRVAVNFSVTSSVLWDVLKKKERRSLDVSRTCHYSQLHVSRLSLPDCIKLLIEGCVSCLFCWKEGPVCIFFIPQKIN